MSWGLELGYQPTMASVLPEAGHIVTVERSSTFAAEAEQNFKQYGMSERITLMYEMQWNLYRN